MSEITEKLYGKEYAEREEAFNKCLLEVEQKHIEYFKERKHPNSLDEERHDELNAHTYFHYDPKSNYTEFRTNLPKEIHDDCMECYMKFFGNENTRIIGKP